MRKMSSERKTLLEMLRLGSRMIRLSFASLLLMALVGCSLGSKTTVREFKAPVLVEVPTRIICPSPIIPKLITPKEMGWPPVPVDLMRKAIPVDHQFFDDDDQNNMAWNYIYDLPEITIGISASDYEKFAIFFIEHKSWMKSVFTKIDVAQGCIDRHNAKADEFRKSVDSNQGDD